MINQCWFHSCRARLHCTISIANAVEMVQCCTEWAIHFVLSIEVSHPWQRLRNYVGFYRCWLVKSDVMPSNIGFFGRCDSWAPFRVSWCQWSIKHDPFIHKRAVYYYIPMKLCLKTNLAWQVRLCWWAKMRELTNLRSAPVFRNFLLLIQARISKM